MKPTKCQWINAVIMCALALAGPVRAQSPIYADSLASKLAGSTTPVTNPSVSNASVSTPSVATTSVSSSEGTSTPVTSSEVATTSDTTNNTKTTTPEAILVPSVTTTPTTTSVGTTPSSTTASNPDASSTNATATITAPAYINKKTGNTVVQVFEVIPMPKSEADSVVISAPIDEQSIYDPDSIIARIDIRMVQMDSLIHRPIGGFGTPEFLRWRAIYTTDSLYLATLDKIAETQASIIKAQSGIQLTGQTYYRPDSAFGIDEETDDVSRYVAKIQAEVRWYFLQSGIYNRHGRIEEINLKTDIERLEHLKNRAEPQLYANRERLRVNSDSILASVMLHRMTNLDMLEQAYLYLLDNENISSDNLLRVLDDRADVERRLSTISTAPTMAPTLAYVKAGTVSIDTMAIFETIYQTDLNLKILEKKSMLLDQQASNTRWLNDVRVAPFARYSHYFRHNMAVSANVDVGVSFTIPINGEASRKRRALLLEKGLINSKRDEVETGAADRVRYIVNEVYRLNRSITGEWNRAQSLKRYLKTRRQAYDRRQGEYNRLSALIEYNGYLKCLENIIEIQYRRDSLLADLQSLMPETPLDRYCAFIPLYTHE